MGGHHHEVHVPKVPDYSIYKIEDAPELVKLQERLAKKGLKDPWLRNHVWRYTLTPKTRTSHWVFLHFATKGWKIWVPLVGLTIAVEHFLGIDYHAHGHGDGHGGHH